MEHLNLSQTRYPQAWLAKLAEQVLLDHPSLLTLELTSVQLTDEMLLAILPFLRSPVLQKIELRGNDLSSACLDQLAIQLRTHCPAPSRGLTANRTERHPLTVRNPQPEDHQTEVTKQLADLKQQIEHHQREQHQRWSEQALLSLRVNTLEADSCTLMMTVNEVQMTLAAHGTQIEESEEKLTELAHDVQEMIPMIQALQERLASVPDIIVDPLAELSGEQIHYVKYFKQILLRMYVAAMVVSTGLVNIQMKTAAGKVSSILENLSGCAPFGTGVVLKIMAYCCAAVDQRIVAKRIERLLSLANDTEEMAQRAEWLGIQLAHCLTYRQPVKQQHLGLFMNKVLSNAQKVVDIVLERDIEQAMIMIIQEGVNYALDTLMPDASSEAIEERAEMDANILFTLIMANGLSTHTSNAINTELFLYAAPLSTIADVVFLLALEYFCRQHSTQTHVYTVEDVDLKKEERRCFITLLSISWRAHPDKTMRILVDEGKRPLFLEETAQVFSEPSLFSFKERKSLPTLFNSSSKIPVYVDKNLLTLAYINTVTEPIMNKINQDIN